LDNEYLERKYGKEIESVYKNLQENLGDFFSKDKLFTMEPFIEKRELKPNIIYQTGEFPYLYETDECGRIIKAYAEELKISPIKTTNSATKKGSRFKHDQKSPGKQEGDHSGHIFGDLFGGSSKIDNLVSQAADVNTIRKNSNIETSYRKIEIEWEKAIKEYGNGSVSNVKVEMLYEGNNLKPDKFKVSYDINGIKQKSYIIENL